jgi:hypothetical protein
VSVQMLLSLMPNLAFLPEAPELFTEGNGLAILGGICVLLAGVFQLSSMGRDRARNHLHQVMGTPVTSLQPLRGAMVAKARGQGVAVFLMLAALFLIADRMSLGEPTGLMLWLLAAALVVLSGVFFVLLGPYVENSMRRHLLTHLRQFPFSFEDNIALTREIGALFGMPSHKEDTLEDYVERIREKLSLPAAPRRVDRLRVPPM